MLSAEFHEKSEEFFDLIAAEHITDEVKDIIENLRAFLLDDVDGRTNRERYLVAEEVETQMKDLWYLLPPEERSSNNNLRDYFDDIMETAAAVLDGPPLVSSYDECEDELDDCDDDEAEEEEGSYDYEERCDAYDDDEGGDEEE